MRGKEGALFRIQRRARAARTRIARPSNSHRPSSLLRKSSSLRSLRTQPAVPPSHAGHSSPLSRCCSVARSCSAASGVIASIVGLADRVEDELALAAEQVELRVLLGRRARVLGEDGPPAHVELVALEVAEDLARPSRGRAPGCPRAARPGRRTSGPRSRPTPCAGRRPRRSTPSPSSCGSRRPASRAPSRSARGSASRTGRAGRPCRGGARRSPRRAKGRRTSRCPARSRRGSRGSSPVACLRMCAVSAISTRNVDSPRTSESDAPTRVKMRSQSPTRAEDAGTNEPACARRTRIAFCLRYVDLPPMFGPVRTTTWDPSPPEGGVVRHERLARAQSLDDGVPAALDGEDGLLDEARTRPAGAAGDARERDERVEEPEPRRRREDAAGSAHDLADDLEEQLELARGEPGVGRAQLLVDLDERGRRVALDVRERLALQRALRDLRARRRPAPRRRARRPG